MVKQMREGWAALVSQGSERGVSSMCWTLSGRHKGVCT